MAEDVKNIEEPIVEDAEDTVETPEKTKSKTFTQSELNNVVQTRLAREKEASKLVKEQYESQIEVYEGVISKMIEKQIGDLDVVTQKLLKKLPLNEQLEFLQDESNFSDVSKKQIPVTPKISSESPEPKKSVKTLNPFKI